MRRLIPAVAAALLATAMTMPTTTASAVAPVHGATRPSQAPLCVKEAICSALGLAPRASTGSARIASDAASRSASSGALCDDGSGATCGTVNVPFDYAKPAGRRLGIAYRVYPHSTAGPALGTLNYIAGSGESSIIVGDRDLDFILGDARAAYDVLLIDGRGRGASGAVDCPLLQHGGTSDIPAAIAECVKILGPAVDVFTSANDARDRDAVRAKLRIAKLDIVAKSYGGMEALAYAARFGKHVESIVLADAVTPATNRFVQRNIDLTSTSARIQKVQCAGSPRCRAELLDPLPGIAAAAKALHAHPLVGDATDLYGQPQHVTVTDLTLYYAAAMDDSAPGSAWLSGAVDSWRKGDDRPLLRIGAALAFSGPILGDSGPADGENNNAAVQAEDCADNSTKPWRDGLSTAQRIASAQAEIRATDQRRYWPFNGSDLNTDPIFAPEDVYLCAYWPDTPKAEPVVPRGATLPDVPVLALVAGFDRRVTANETAEWAARFPKGTVTLMPAGAHPYALFLCGDTVDAFLRSGSAPTTCATDWHWWPQASNPRSVAKVSAAAIERARGDASTAADRRIADATWRTFVDGWNSTNRAGFSITNGLRGGSLTDSYDDTASEYHIDFDHYRFVDDLAITGGFVGPAEGPTHGTYALDGPKGVTGSLTITADMNTDRDGTVTIDGTIGGRAVHLTTTSF